MGELERPNKGTAMAPNWCNSEVWELLVLHAEDETS